MTASEPSTGLEQALTAVRAAYPDLAPEELQATTSDYAPGAWIVTLRTGEGPSAGGSRYYVEKATGRTARVSGSLPPRRAYAEAIKQFRAAGS